MIKNSRIIKKYFSNSKTKTNIFVSRPQVKGVFIESQQLVETSGVVLTNFVQQHRGHLHEVGDAQLRGDVVMATLQRCEAGGEVVNDGGQLELCGDVSEQHFDLLVRLLTRLLLVLRSR